MTAGPLVFAGLGPGAVWYSKSRASTDQSGPLVSCGGVECAEDGKPHPTTSERLGMAQSMVDAVSWISHVVWLGYAATQDRRIQRGTHWSFCHSTSSVVPAGVPYVSAHTHMPFRDCYEG